MDKRYLVTGILIIVFYSLALNLPFLWEREFQGEAARRAVAALEMMERGDYLIPYIEDQPYLLKPPGYNWVLVGFFKLFGSHSEFVARLSSVTAATLCALFLVLLFRAVAQPPGLLWVLPGLIFLSFPEVLDKACRAEIDMTYTLLVTLSVFSWFYLHEIRKSPYLAWTVALGFSALATLTKTFQALAFLYAAVGPYLFFKRRFQELFSPAHLLGLFVYAGIFSLWFVPAAQRIGAERILSAWFGEYLSKKNPLEPSGFWGHFLRFPLEYLEGYFPWIVFGLLWLRNRGQETWKRLPEPLRALTLFSFLGLVFSFPFYWLLPGTRLRYLLPTAGGLSFLLALPIVNVLEREENPYLLRWGLKAFALLILITLPLFMIVSYHKLHLKENPWAWGSLLLTGLLATGLLRATDLRRKISFLFLLWAGLRLTFGASYFIYQENYRSHYFQAAQKLQTFLPRNIILCDYGLNSPHLTYYLKYKLKWIKSMRFFPPKSSIQNCNYVISYQPLIEKKKWQLLAFLKARRTPLWVYSRGTGTGGEGAR